jgi:hypothetical protein
MRERKSRGASQVKVELQSHSSCLAKHDLQVDISRCGVVIVMLVNQQTPVTTQDNIASNGVIRSVDEVLLPRILVAGHGEETGTFDLDVSSLKSMFDSSL